MAAHSSVTTFTPRQPYQEFCDEKALERARTRKDKHSIEDIPELSAKREELAKYQQEQRQQELEHQSHQVTYSIMR